MDTERASSMQHGYRENIKCARIQREHQACRYTEREHQTCTDTERASSMHGYREHKACIMDAERASSVHGYREIIKCAWIQREHQACMDTELASSVHGYSKIKPRMSQKTFSSMAAMPGSHRQVSKEQILSVSQRFADRSLLNKSEPSTAAFVTINLIFIVIKHSDRRFLSHKHRYKAFYRSSIPCEPNSQGALCNVFAI
ncbi:Hypothetical predicted protein [Pelobates cultripes]|uniref:Uncharacterized protein n=1 Tax=Pelobates cultripes TaxID=61616 RepID=A0AAD1S8B0_PELCU|nr:Hypothetical predicted protein [Pelobates cultripes]